MSPKPEDGDTGPDLAADLVGSSGPDAAKDKLATEQANLAAQNLKASIEGLASSGVQQGNVKGAAQSATSTFKAKDSSPAPSPGGGKKKGPQFKGPDGDTFGKQMTRNMVEWMNLVSDKLGGKSLAGLAMKGMQKMLNSDSAHQMAKGMSQVAKGVGQGMGDAFKKMTTSDKQVFAQGVQKMADMTQQADQDFQANPTAFDVDEKTADSADTLGDVAPADEGSLEWNPGGDGKSASVKYTPPAHDEDEEFDDEFGDDASGLDEFESVGQDVVDEKEAAKTLRQGPSKGEDDLGTELSDMSSLRPD